jgi:indole-3-glycerol phosphate synthase
MADMLSRICDAKRAHVARAKVARPLSQVASLAKAQDPPRGFKARLAARVAAGDYGLIAEIKKASPSKGLIRADFDPPALARAYRDGGATCLSVLTDMPYFQGADADLVAARNAVDLPVLRKDFIIDPYQVVEARALGADAVLLILAAVDDVLAGEIERTGLDLGMDVLIEIHDAGEAERAQVRASRLIGINNRDLKSLRVDLATTLRLAPELPRDALVVCESGLGRPADLARVAEAGVRCFLVGESLMREPDVATATRALLARAAQRIAAGGEAALNVTSGARSAPGS